MLLLLDVSPAPPIGLAELLILSVCCGLGVLVVGGGAAIAFLLKRKKKP